MQVTSDAGDWVGQGEPYFFTTADGTFTAQSFAGGVTIDFATPDLSAFWSFGFAAPSGAPLTTGLYPNATRFPTPSDPGLDVNGTGRGCNETLGQFEILELAYGETGDIVSLRARFEQYCDGSLVALRGEIRFNAHVYVEMTVDRRVVGPAGQPISVPVTGVPLDGGPVTLSASALPGGASFTDNGDGTGRLDWTPDQVGAYTVTFAGTDSLGGRDSLSTTILVGRVIRVPGDSPTIQAAIDAAPPGSEVIVAPGTYSESLTFFGKPLRVTSEAGREATIIDGGGQAPVAIFRWGEGRDSVLDGFTLRNGFAPFDAPYFSEGGNVHVSLASPTIANNIITGGSSCDGAAIGVELGAPLIRDNVIRGNSQGACSGGGGGAIFLLGQGRTEVLDNLIADNVTGGNGGGLELFGTTRPTLRGNAILRNFALQGGGVDILGQTGVEMIGNLVADNRAYEGGGIVWDVNYGDLHPRLVNNTIAGNDGGTDSGIVARGLAPAELVNNIVIGVAGQTALFCNGPGGVDTGAYRFNDLFSPGGGTYGAGCQVPTAPNGNISADAKFQCAALHDYRPAPGSPVIDAGNDTVPGLPPFDLAGRARIIDGNGDGAADVDLGAYEFDPSAPLDHCVYLTCPADIHVTAPSGQTSTTVTYPTPVGSPGATISCTPRSGGEFPAGTTMVTCTATDPAGNSDSCTFAISVYGPPPNDDFSFATPIRRLPFTARVDTWDATAADDDPACSGPQATVWYQFTPPVDRILILDTSGSSYETTIGAFTGMRGGLQQLGCGQRRIVVMALARQTLYFAVGSLGSGGELVFTMSGKPPLSVTLSLDHVGTLSPDAGTISIQGTVRCNRAATVSLSGSLAGWNERPPAPESFSTQLSCAGWTRWAATVTSPGDFSRVPLASLQVLADAEESSTGARASDRRQVTIVVQRPRANVPRSTHALRSSAASSK